MHIKHGDDMDDDKLGLTILGIVVVLLAWCLASYFGTNEQALTQLQGYMKLIPVIG